MAQDPSNFTVFYKQDNPKIDRLLEIYAKDPVEAKLYRRLMGGLTYNDLVHIKTRTGFVISNRTISVGVSKTNRIYRSKKENTTYIVKDKYAYIKAGNRFRQLLVNEVFNKSLKPYFLEKYPWLRNFEEITMIGSKSLISVTNKKSINWCIKNECFNQIDYLYKLYGVPRNVVKDLVKIVDHRQWKMYKDHLICNTVNPELFENIQYVKDAMHMAYQADVKINLGWSLKRMILEHDELSKKLTSYRATLDNRPLKIAKRFLEFHEFSKYRILKTTAELVHEGAVKKHCVGGYDYQVDGGTTAIFSIEGYTCEILKSKVNGKLSLGQMQGIYNAQAEQKYVDQVTNMLNEFNNLHPVEQQELRDLTAAELKNQGVVAYEWPMDAIEQ